MNMKYSYAILATIFSLLTVFAAFAEDTGPTYAEKLGWPMSRLATPSATGNGSPLNFNVNGSNGCASNTPCRANKRCPDSENTAAVSTSWMTITGSPPSIDDFNQLVEIRIEIDAALSRRGDVLNRIAGKSRGGRIRSVRAFRHKDH